MLQIRQNKIMATVDDVPTWLALAFERVVEAAVVLALPLIVPRVPCAH
jgi:hypothetical protein